jgi:hypothetical protein
MPEILIPYKDMFCPCQFDSKDEPLISQYTWYIHNGYAATYIKGKCVFMHRIILCLNDPKIFADHKDGNKLNNLRHNLRPATPKENRRNSRKEKNCSSKYKGSYFETERGVYHSQIGFATDNGTKVYNLGRYSNEMLAGKAYDRKAIQLFGQFACTNFSSSRESQQLTFPWI